MLLRNLLATLIATMRLFQRSATWIALAVLLIVGVIQVKLRMALYPPWIDGPAKPSMLSMELVTLFGFIGMAFVILALSRALAREGSVARAIPWGAWALTNLGIFAILNGVQFAIAKYAYEIVEPETIRAVDPVVSGLLQWLLFLPFLRTVFLARGSTNVSLEDINDRMSGKRVVWFGGFALLVLLLTLILPLLVIDYSQYDVSDSTLGLLTGFRFAIASLVPWLFAIAAADQFGISSEIKAEIFE